MLPSLQKFLHTFRNISLCNPNHIDTKSHKLVKVKFTLEQVKVKVKVKFTLEQVKVKVKVKFTLEQATKAQRGSRCIALLLL